MTVGSGQARPEGELGPDVVAALARTRARIAAACVAAGRPRDAVRLMAVSKLQPPERVAAALTEGQLLFGENYVQEAAARWPALRERHEGVEVHLIGALQTNKAAEALAVADVIQTLDRPKLAAALARARDKTGRTCRFLVEVNLAAEPQKAGVLPADLDGFLDALDREFALPVEGLMAIPPEAGDTAHLAAELAKMAGRHGLAEVSIGMSGDFEAAIAGGATLVRVGSGIFGARPARGQPAPAVAGNSGA